MLILFLNLKVSQHKYYQCHTVPLPGQEQDLFNETNFGGPFGGSTGTLCFGCFVTLPIGFKAMVDPLLSHSLACVLWSQESLLVRQFFSLFTPHKTEEIRRLFLSGRFDSNVTLWNLCLWITHCMVNPILSILLHLWYVRTDAIQKCCTLGFYILSRHLFCSGLLDSTEVDRLCSPWFKLFVWLLRYFLFVTERLSCSSILLSPCGSSSYCGMVI